MTVELFTLLSTTVSIAFQIKSSLEQIEYNRARHRSLVNRITSSLAVLQTESRKILRSSPGLIHAVQNLKLKLEQVLKKCQRPNSGASGIITKLVELLYKDSITVALQDIDTEISSLFQEFGAFTAVRIERKLGDHDIQVNHKLDELLKRTPIRPVHGNLTRRIPLRACTSESSASSSSDKALDPPGLSKNHSMNWNSPSKIRSPTLTASQSDTLVNSSTHSLPATELTSKSPSAKVSSPMSHRSVRSTGFLPAMKSDSSFQTQKSQDTISSSSLYEFQANKLDSECKRLRSLKLLSEALIPGRKAVSLRRMVYAANKTVTTAAALARSLTYLARCLKDLHVDAHFTGTKVGVELTAVLSESVELYKTAFKEDKACRVDLATALYNLSVRQSEPVTKNVMSSTSTPSLNTHISFNEIHRSKKLVAALGTAEEAVHHFTVLEREDPSSFGIDLANALLNLSFVFSDVGNNARALGIARKAVMLSYRLPLPHTQERVRNQKTLHKALMRVSYCLENLGKLAESKEAEMEANDVLRKPFFTVGS